MQIDANGIALEYEEFGSQSDPVLILIRGLGTQMIRWPQELIDGFVGEGLRVVIFDNRDVGLSQKFDVDGASGLAYSLDDMAKDVTGLMDALGISAAHIFGISMGGMIAQRLAAWRGDRVLSMTSVMSSTGNPDLPPPTPAAMKTLALDPNRPTDRDRIIAASVAGMKVIGSPGFESSDNELLDAATASYDRCFNPAGVARQLAAIQAAGDRRGELKDITCPVLVIHGADDPLLRVECGRDTAANIAHAELEIVEGMGHDTPPGLAPVLVGLVAPFIAKAKAR
jgi:pimeloyl-ACP methyl ester carboxylesterase